MKKWIAILLALILALSVTSVSLAGLAEEEETPDYGRRVPDSLIFDSKWVCGYSMANLVPEDDGFRVEIAVTDNLAEGFLWEYACWYDAESKALVSAGFGGSKRAVTWDEAGVMTYGEELLDGCEATFEINERGQLVWHEEAENAGENLLFDKIGRFDETTWVCGRACITMYWNIYDYRAMISWGNTAAETSEWDYAVRYDAEQDALIGSGVHMNRTYAENGDIAAEEIIFEDGPVEFRLDENGFLLWIDQVENAGDGMAFEPVEIYEF